MIAVRCPICSKSFTIARLDELPSFPFCSDRCKLVDLGRWIDGDYAIPEKLSSDQDLEIQSEEED